MRAELCTTAACSRFRSSTLPALAAAGHPPEQVGDATVDRLLRRAERGRHLLVAEALGHHVEDLAVLLVGVLAAGQPFGDRRVDHAAPLVHLVDRAHELVALRDPVLQEVREAAVALPEQRDGVLRVVVRGQDHHAGVGVLLADRVRAVDPFELERRRHLDVGDDDVGHVLGGRRPCSVGASEATPTTSMSS